MVWQWVSGLKLIFVPSEANNFRPKFLESRVLLYCLVFLFILKLLAVPFLLYFPKSVFFSDISKTILIELLNKDRQSTGLLPLKENATLNKAALLKAQDILAKDYFSHQSPEGISPWHWFKSAGYNYQFAGENLAIGFLDSAEVHQAWLDSASHRANLFNSNYKEVGVAVVRGEFQNNQTAVVVQLFGDPEKIVSEKIVSGPQVQTKGQLKEDLEEIKKQELPPEPEKTEKEATEEQTLSGEFVSAAKEVKPTLIEIQEKATFSFLSFFASDYYKILQVVIYGFLGLIILALLINIFVRFDIQHRDLILKALGFIVVLILFILVDKGVLIRMIPHNFNIY